jgi:hypothetical protein
VDDRNKSRCPCDYVYDELEIGGGRGEDRDAELKIGGQGEDRMLR